jgi:hypothetical protein
MFLIIVLLLCGKGIKKPKTISKYGKSDKNNISILKIELKNNIQIWKCKTGLVLQRKAYFCGIEF